MRPEIYARRLATATTRTSARGPITVFAPQRVPRKRRTDAYAYDGCDTWRALAPVHYAIADCIDLGMPAGFIAAYKGVRVEIYGRGGKYPIHAHDIVVRVTRTDSHAAAAYATATWVPRDEQAIADGIAELVVDVLLGEDHDLNVGQ